jgi:RNA polymerase sigma-70 factor (ECF subfamily)
MDLTRLFSGDSGNWAEFVEHYAGIVYAAVRKALERHTGRVHAADLQDASNEVFLRLIKDDYRLLRTFNPDRASLSTWLTVVARSTAIDYLRKSRRHETGREGLIDIMEAPASSRPIADSLPADLLTSRQRLIMELLYDQGLTPGEVAHMLDIEVQTVRGTRHKILNKLREHMGLR